MDRKMASLRPSPFTSAIPISAVTNLPRLLIAHAGPKPRSRLLQAANEPARDSGIRAPRPLSTAVEGSFRFAPDCVGAKSNNMGKDVVASRSADLRTGKFGPKIVFGKLLIIEFANE